PQGRRPALGPPGVAHPPPRLAGPAARRPAGRSPPVQRGRGAAREQAPLRPGKRRAVVRRVVPAGSRPVGGRRRRRAGGLGAEGGKGLGSRKPAERRSRTGRTGKEGRGGTTSATISPP